MRQTLLTLALLALPCSALASSWPEALFDKTDPATLEDTLAGGCLHGDMAVHRIDHGVICTRDTTLGEATRAAANIGNRWSGPAVMNYRFDITQKGESTYVRCVMFMSDGHEEMDVNDDAYFNAVQGLLVKLGGHRPS